MRQIFSLGFADQEKWELMPFTSLILRSVLQRLNLYYSLLSLSNSSHSSTLFVFLFPFLPITLNFTHVRAFHLSPFLLHCAMNCLFTFSDSFRISRLSVVHSLLSSSCTLWQFSWLSMRRSWQKLPPTVTEAWPTRNLGCQDPAPWSQITPVQILLKTFSPSLPPDPSRRCHTLFLHQDWRTMSVQSIGTDIILQATHTF